jgi:choline dehydrogenase-like flavoprotein
MRSIGADVCIIGAGAAGLTLARELSGSRLSVCLLESGSRSPAPVEDPRYEVVSTAQHVARESRVRAYGGTMTVWSGRWKRFDAIDLAPRAWVPHSGWPLTLDDLGPFYERADRAAGFRPVATPPSPLRSTALVPSVFWSQPVAQRNWGLRMLEASNLRVLLDSHVVRLDRSNRAVTRVIVAGDVEITARFVVVAAGGIENARLLLLSDLGNEHDQVGRYYMDHPKARHGMVEAYEPIPTQPWESIAEDSPVYLGFRLADELQREHRTLNSHVLFQPMFDRGVPGRIARRLRNPTTCRMLAVRNYLEQPPDPENRVTLHSSRDDLGLPKAAVHWRIGEDELETMRVFHRVLRHELQRSGLGELDSALLHGGQMDLVDASHHMGTTRMGHDPRTSVVDPSCRVHGLDNLFVAGSSVFPTGGYANPTATLCALAIRLADHLEAIA